MPVLHGGYAASLLSLFTALLHLICICKAVSFNPHRQASAAEDALVAWLRTREENCSSVAVSSAEADLINIVRGGGGGGAGRRSHCPAVFDGFACWPRTPAGRVARQPCPQGVFRNDDRPGGGSAAAWRECLPEGNWRFPGEAAAALAAGSNASAAAQLRLVIGSSYTNYTECAPSGMHGALESRLLRTQVSKVHQSRRVNLEGGICRALSAAHNRSAAGSGDCPPVFDNVICWPRAQAGSIVLKSCPDYINAVSRRGLAWRICLTNGSWFRPPGTPHRVGGGDGWTNFSNCLVQNVVNDLRLVQAVHSVGHIGYGISLVFLLLAISILASFRRLHCQKNAIHINLFAAFALRAASHFFNYTVDVSKGSPALLPVCRFQQSLLTYTVIASFTWVFVEALHLYMLIFVNTMSSSKLSMAAYMAIGWGPPCLITGIWVTLRILFDNRECWRKYMPMGADIWLINVYLCLLVFVKAGLFARIVRELFVKLKNQPRTSAASQSYRKLWRSTSVLVIVFGVYNIIFLPVSMIPKDKLSDTMDYIKLSYEHFFTSFQGVFVSLLFCFVNSDVHLELKRRLLETRLGNWLKSRGWLRPADDVYGLEPGNRRANRRAARAAPPETIDESIPLKTTVCSLENS